MSLEAYSQEIVRFVSENEQWAAPAVFALAFGESLAFVSLLVPAWAALVALGVVIGGSDVSFWPVWIAASLGAALGSWLSYWIASLLKRAVYRVWPLSRYPDLVPKGEAFVKKWGVAGIFIAQFFGPLRAVAPLVAGVFAMPFWQFQLANFGSSFVWGAVILQMGWIGSELLGWG